MAFRASKKPSSQTESTKIQERQEELSKSSTVAPQELSVDDVVGTPVISQNVDDSSQNVSSIATQDVSALVVPPPQDMGKNYPLGEGQMQGNGYGSAGQSGYRYRYGRRLFVRRDFVSSENGCLL
ncbi:MAG: hypothetical protein N3A54_02200, partial [Patescibacteria group bacterium]|nr:hypothetical protein [Patescibacteria group bacterium]